MIRTKGEAGSGNIVEAVRHMRTILSEIKTLEASDKITDMRVPIDLLKQAEIGKLPVPNFSVGGLHLLMALTMHLGADAVFVGSGTLCLKIHLKEQRLLLKQ